DALVAARRRRAAGRTIDPAGSGSDRHGRAHQAGGLPRAHRGGALSGAGPHVPARLGSRLSRSVELPDRAPALARAGAEQQQLLRQPCGGRAARPRRRGARARAPAPALPQGRGAHPARRAVGPALSPGERGGAPSGGAWLRVAPAPSRAIRDRVGRLVNRPGEPREAPVVGVAGGRVLASAPCLQASTTSSSASPTSATLLAAPSARLS